ncbi:MAG: phosphopentomutase [bacterium JZ-2024 1]
MRVFLLILDGVGIGETEDAGDFGDKGSATLQNALKAAGDPRLPFFERFGLFHTFRSEGFPFSPLASYGRMRSFAPAKDTLSGHWELMGAVRQSPPKYHPNGFSQEIIKTLERETGIQFLWGKPASGTEIIQKLGETHLQTGKWILYTSADSVMQFAVHLSVVDGKVEQIYEVCRRAQMLAQKYGWVDRIIARPFEGSPGNFLRRNDLRKDFLCLPVAPNLLQSLSTTRYTLISVGKISDIFGGAFFTHKLPAHTNQEVFQQVFLYADKDFEGLLFANFNDFDTLYGHRNDALGFVRALQWLDENFPSLLEKFTPDDWLIVTSDHGNDPTTPSTDHSREWVPLLVYKKGKKAVYLGDRESLSDVSATLAEIFQVDFRSPGKSFYGFLR